jgi:hypothetical protein
MRSHCKNDHTKSIFRYSQTDNKQTKKNNMILSTNRIILTAVASLMLINTLLFMYSTSYIPFTSNSALSTTTTTATTTTSSSPLKLSIQQFKYAVNSVQRLMPFCEGMFYTTPMCHTEKCNKLPFGVSFRPQGHTPDVVGNNCEPWIRREAVLILNKLLNKNMLAMEWGSGSSSIWYLNRVRHLISVEHNIEWSKLVKSRIRKLMRNKDLNWTLKIIPPSPVTESEENQLSEDLKWTASSSINGTFVDYISAPVPPEYKGNFDLIIVDGRARMGCLRRAVQLLKREGGILVLDNSERKIYENQELIVPPWWIKHVTGDTSFGQTTIWFSVDL